MRRPAAPPRSPLCQADEAQAPVAQLHAHEVPVAPLAPPERCVGLGCVAGQREHKRHGVLGGGDRVGRGSVDHGDAALRGGLQVDVVHANARAADDLEPLAGGYQLGRHLRFAADHQRVVAADDAAEHLRLQARADFHPMLGGGQPMDPLLGDGVRHQNACHGASVNGKGLAGGCGCEAQPGQRRP